jgi:hypothetical protein
MYVVGTVHEVPELMVRFRKLPWVYLESLLNNEDVPLTYILRDCEIQSLHPGPMQDKIKHAPHAGPQFVNDNHQVLQLIKTWVATTTIFSVIENSNQASVAWAVLCNHFEGDDTKMTAIQSAEKHNQSTYWYAVIWYSKRQNTIESSTFGSEFVSLKIALEMNKALSYKLRMMGIPVDGPTNCFCDNQSVWRNATVPQSTLNKKHNSVAYHKCREYVAMETVRIAFEAGKDNLSDCLTKFLAAPALKKCVQCILFR